MTVSGASGAPANLEKTLHAAGCGTEASLSLLVSAPCLATAQGKEATWVNQASLYGRSQLKIDSAAAEDSGNYTCVIENTKLIDSISYSLKIQGKSHLSVLCLNITLV